MANILKAIEKNGKTVLKAGRRTVAEVIYNTNPDYKYCLYFKGGICLSGYETKEAAIERAERMQIEWNNTISQILKPY